MIVKRQLNLKQLACVNYYTEYLFQQNGISNYTKLYEDSRQTSIIISIRCY